MIIFSFLLHLNIVLTITLLISYYARLIEENKSSFHFVVVEFNSFYAFVIAINIHCSYIYYIWSISYFNELSSSIYS